MESNSSHKTCLTYVCPKTTGYVAHSAAWMAAADYGDTVGVVTVYVSTTRNTLRTTAQKYKDREDP